MRIKDMSEQQQFEIFASLISLGRKNIPQIMDGDYENIRYDMEHYDEIWQKQQDEVSASIRRYQSLIH